MLKYAKKLMDGVVERALKRHEGEHDGYDSANRREDLGKEHARRHTAGNDKGHLGADQVSKCMPAIHEHR